MKSSKLIKLSYNQNSFVYIPCDNVKWEVFSQWAVNKFTSNERDIVIEGSIIILQALLTGNKRFDSVRLKNIFKKSIQNITLSVGYDPILKELATIGIISIKRQSLSLPGIYSLCSSDAFMLLVDNKLYTSLLKRVN